MSKILGIDLGTTNSCMAIIEGGKPTVIANAEGIRTTPSVVAFAKNGERLVGEPAKRQAVTNTDRTISSIKRKMGTNEKVYIEGKSFTPQEISAIILQKLKKDAESYLGQSISDVVVTVPAYFNDIQRQATKDACKISGLNVKRVINEPTAAALAYGLGKDINQKIMVYDLGGGTFDISIIEIGNGVIEVLSTNGDTKLGGDDFDLLLSKYIFDEYKKQYGNDISGDKIVRSRVLEAAEKAKKELSSTMVTNVNLPFIYSDATGAKHLDINITREKFNSIVDSLIRRTEIPMNNALKDAGLRYKDIDKIILVGGSTRMLIVSQFIERVSGKKPLSTLNPDECVAVGACIQGDTLSGESMLPAILLLDVTPLTLSVKCSTGMALPLIKRNSTIPIKNSEIFSTAEDMQNDVKIEVFQGERAKADDNKHIGDVVLSGILPASAGVPKINVTFSIDENGILSVSAMDMATKRKTTSVMHTPSLSDYEISNAIDDANRYKERDEEYIEKVKILNAIEEEYYKHKKNVEKLNFGPEEKDEINTKLVVLKNMMDNPDNYSFSDMDYELSDFRDSIKVVYDEFYKNTREDMDNNYKDTNYAEDDFYGKF